MTSTIKEYPHSHVMKKIKDGHWEANYDVKKGRYLEIIDHANKKKRKMIKVGEETINEISKKTLGSYVVKAANGIGFSMHDAGSQITRHAMNGSRDSNSPEAVASTKSWEKAKKRLSGLKLATKKLTKEETVEINELSKKTLGSYVKKAAESGAVHHGNQVRAQAANDEASRLTNRNGISHPKGQFGFRHDVEKALGGTQDDINKHYSKVGKRLRGIDKAVGKLTKEENEMTTRFTELAQNSDASGFQQKFNEVLADKVAGALEDKKAEIAQAFFGEGKSYKKNDDSGSKKDDRRTARKFKQAQKTQKEEVEALDEAYKPTHVKPMTKEDRYGWAGATDLPSGKPPHIHTGEHHTVMVTGSDSHPGHHEVYTQHHDDQDGHHYTVRSFEHEHTAMAHADHLAEHPHKISLEPKG